MTRRTTALALESLTIGDARSYALDGPGLLVRLLDTAAEYVLRL